jgi:predicted Zn-dependent peptidase
MKPKISLLITLFLLSIGLSAQIDRSQPPKSGPAPKISLETPKEFVLDNGMKVLVLENHKLPRVSYSLTIDNPPIFEGDKAGVSTLLAAMLGNGTTSIPKDVFNEEIDYLGARLSFGSQSAFASTLSKYSERILELMADAAINPLLTEKEFQKEKDRLIEGLKAQEKDVDAIAGRVATALAYGTHHPYGEFTTEDTVNNVTLENVNAFYQKYFNLRNAYLVIIGDVEYETIKAQVETYFGKWNKPIAVEITVPEASPNVQYTQINFVDMPNAVQSNISLMNTASLKMSNPDYHAVLIANNILGGGTDGYLFDNLRETSGYTYSASSTINASQYISRFRAGASVRNMVTDSSVVQILKEVNRIRNEEVTAKRLADAKAKYVGNFVLALEQPRTIAQYALNIKINDLPEDFYTTYLEKINAVSIEDVKRVANKYFLVDKARILVVGKGSEVLENLEKTGIPIKYYDKFANPVDKPEFTKPIPEGVTAQSVLDKYISVIGGKDNVQAVKSVFSSADVTIEGAPFAPKAEIKQMVPNKESIEMSIEGMGVLMKQKFNGEAGYIEQQGQKMPLEGDILESQKAKLSLFSELYYDDSYGISLESLTMIDGNDVYKLKVEKNGKASYRYYNAESGFLVREESTVDMGGNEVTTTADYAQYSPVKGYQIVKSGPQTFIFNITNILVNEGVSDEDFN